MLMIEWVLVYDAHDPLRPPVPSRHGFGSAVGAAGGGYASFEPEEDGTGNGHGCGDGSGTEPETIELDGFCIQSVRPSLHFTAPRSDV